MSVESVQDRQEYPPAVAQMPSQMNRSALRLGKIVVRVRRDAEGRSRRSRFTHALAHLESLNTHSLEISITEASVEHVTRPSLTNSAGKPHQRWAGRPRHYPLCSVVTRADRWPLSASGPPFAIPKSRLD